jgi:hypothetical protein
MMMKVLSLQESLSTGVGKFFSQETSVISCFLLRDGGTVSLSSLFVNVYKKQKHHIGSVK